MNITTTTKMTLLLLMLCSGFFHFTSASPRLRHFQLSELDEHTRQEVLQECQSNNASLLTLYDDEDARFIANFTAKIIKSSVGGVWLGLHHSRITTWSNGEPVIFNQTSVNVTDGGQKCEAIQNNTWQSFNCSDKKHFMCYNGNDYTLVNISKTWCQALQHCKNNHGNLVSINSTEQNDKVIGEGENSSFWIGLMHDEWQWEDNGCSTFRRWHDTGDTESPDCTRTWPSLKSDGVNISKYGCDNEKHSICAHGTVRIKVIQEKLTWEDAYDYCQDHHSRLLWIEDGEDQHAVEQWLNHTDVSGPFWIGLRQSRVFGFWIWTSDTTVGYSNWKNGVTPKLHMSHHCGVINTEDYKWNDEDCRYPRPFLCEEEIIYFK